MRIILYSFVLLLVAHVSSANTYEKIIKDNQQSVFILKCYNEKNEVISTSNGFFIDNSGIAISNIHFLKEAYKAKVETFDGRLYEVEKLLDYNPALDLAKIQVKRPLHVTFPSVRISNKLYRKGDQVFTLESEEGGETKLFDGVISSLNAIYNYGICYEVSASLSAAGGVPIFNSTGEVIAVTTFTTTTQNTFVSASNYAVNIGSINKLNNQLNLLLEKSSKEIVFEDFVPAYMHAILLKNYEASVDICNKAILKKPYSWLAYHYRAMSELEVKKYKEAEEDFLKALKMNNSTLMKESDYIGLGRIYRHLKQFEEAKEAYNKALKMNLKSAKCHCELAELAEEWLGPQHIFVQTSYSRALELDSASCSFGYRTLGFKYLSDHEFDKGKYYLSRAIEFETDKQSLVIELYNLGNCNYELGEYKKAIESFENCIQLMPEDFESSINIGLCYLALGNKTQAYASFKRSRRIVETYQLGKEALGKVTEELHKHFSSK